jgi:hypothetical protein
LLELSRNAKRLGKTKEAQAIRDKRRLIVELVSKLNHYEEVDIPGWIQEPPTCYEPGWYLRSAIVWAKGLSFCPTYSGSVMPESVTDRPTSAYEHVFLLSKSKRYFYDAEAVRERWADDRQGCAGAAQWKYDSIRDRTSSTINSSEPPRVSGRNLRNVWTINPAGFPGAHFATFPPALIRPMILAGTSERGACPSCGSRL